MERTFRLPLESRKSSSPRSTRSMILRIWLTEMLALSWLVEKLRCEPQSGRVRVDSSCQGPMGSRSEGVVSTEEGEVSKVPGEERSGERTVG